MKGSLQPAAIRSHLKPVLLSVVLTATPGLAAAQFKCVDKSGNITLTDVACPGRNMRGQTSGRAAPADTTESMRQSAGYSSATVNRGNLPAKSQSLDAANEKPPARGKSAPTGA